MGIPRTTPKHCGSGQNRLVEQTSLPIFHLLQRRELNYGKSRFSLQNPCSMNSPIFLEDGLASWDHVMCYVFIGGLFQCCWSWGPLSKPIKDDIGDAESISSTIGIGSTLFPLVASLFHGFCPICPFKLGLCKRFGWEGLF